MNACVQKLLKRAQILAVAGATALMLASAPAPARAAEDLALLVDPFVATKVDNGQQTPAAVVPYGLVKLSSDTYPHVNDDHSGYDYGASKISGFSHTRIEGVGGQGAGGDVLVTPTYVTYTAKPTLESRAQDFSHDDEQATPGYYQVGLTPNKGQNTAEAAPELGTINAEMTATTRTGFHRYTFPAAGEASLVLDLNYTYHGTDIRNAQMDLGTTADGKTSISGRFSGRNVSGHGTYTLYFYTVVDTPVESVHTWNGDAFDQGDHLTGNDLGAVLQFKVAAGQKIQLKTAVSPISVEQAQTDMAAEDAGWDFDQVRAQAHDAWNAMLSRVTVESSATGDPDGTMKRMFYTQLYRMFTTPVNATSTSGTYRGTDGKVYRAEGYTHYDSWTMWDDFRKYPMIGLIAPTEYRDIVQSVADMFVTGISTWGNDHQSVPTVRNEHAVALLADGVSKGYTDIRNLDAAFEAAKKFVVDSYPAEAQALGYVPGRVDQTVERSYDYWALSKIARALGKADEAKQLLEQAMGYKKLYRENAATATDGSQVGLLWPRDAAGNWMDANPEQYGWNGMYQGTIWQYTWWDSNDVGGLMDLMGGKDKMLSALNTLYGAKGADADGTRMLHSNTNEIDLQTPYYFNFAGKPSETQYWVRQIYTGKTWNRYSGTGEFKPPQYVQAYRFAPDGLLQTMDDDAGTMATMYASAAMGVFPLAPGDATFQIGSPFFERMTLNVGSGKTFTIKADGVSAKSYYVQGAQLNGASFNRTWLDYGEISRGGELDLTMGSKASDWAEDGAQAPSASDAGSNPLYGYQLTYGETTVPAQDGAVKGEVTAKLSGGATFASALGADAVQVEGLPDGVAAQVERVSDTEVKIAFTGTVKQVTAETEAFPVRVVFADGAFAGGVKASEVENMAGTALGALQIKNEMVPTALTVTAPAKVDYRVGDALDLAGGSVRVVYGQSGFARELPLSSGELKVAGLPKDAGKGQAVQVTYKTAAGEAEGSFTVNVSAVAPDANGAVAYWDFSSVDGSTVRDASGNGYDAELWNGAAVAGGTLSLTGTQRQYLDIPVGVLGGLSGDATISAWVDLDSTSNNQMMLGAGSDKDNFFVMALNDAFRCGLNVEGAGEQRTVADSGVPAGTWAYVSYVQKGTAASLYVNGKKVATGAADHSLAAAVAKAGAFVHLGGIDFWGDPYFDGRISSLAVYDKALDADAIAAEMKRTDARLADEVARAETVLDAGGLSVDQARALTRAQDAAKAVADDPTATAKEVDAALKALEDAIAAAKAGTSPTAKGSAYDTIQAESKDDWSGGALKTETSRDNTSGSDVGDVGGTYDGGWLKFSGRDFGATGAAKFTVRYVNNSNRCGTNCRVELYLDGRDGKPVATVSLPATADNWNVYGEASVDVPAGITGVHDVYAVMRTDGGNAGYVANFDWFRFTEAKDATVGKIEAEGRDDWSGGGLKTEGSKDADGKQLTNVGNTHDGDWLLYKGLDFGSTGKNEFSVRYVNNSARCGRNNRVEIRLDSRDGDPVATVPVLETGSNWSAYQTVTAMLPQAITGTHDVYLTLRTDGGNAGYVGNFDWFSFSYNDDRERLSQAIADARKVLAGASGYRVADVKRLEDAVTAGQAVLDGVDASADELKAACGAITTAQGRLHQKADTKELSAQIERAKATDSSHWTEGTKQALASALAWAEQVAGNDEATQAEVDAAAGALKDAVSGGVEVPEAGKATLNGLISQAWAIGPTGYTKKSWGALQDKIEAAKKVAADRWATPDEVQAAATALKEARAALKRS